jgi:hypothetical protein
MNPDAMKRTFDRIMVHFLPIFNVMGYWSPAPKNEPPWKAISPRQKKYYGRNARLPEKARLDWR